MNRRTSIIALTACLLAGVLYLAHAANIKTENVSYKSGTETVSGYLAEPGGSGKHPAIIVIHEWWGLNDWVKQQADNYAKQGYVALAVDLYRGKSASSADDAHILMRGLP